jgi:hypothetical protein
VERIKRKILEHRPNQIVLGASAPQCKQLYEDLSNITGDLLDTEAQFIRDLENGALEVKFASEWAWLALLCGCSDCVVCCVAVRLLPWGYCLSCVPCSVLLLLPHRQLLKLQAPLPARDASPRWF